MNLLTEQAQTSSDVVLSEEQDQAVAAAARLGEGGCMFITGKAGTGKSTVLRELRNRVRAVVLAPTGLAAVEVRGQTIHSFFGLRPGMVKPPPLPERAQRLLPYVDVLVVDEMSMVRADLLDVMDASMRTFLKVDLPFGGKPFVGFGDIWQLEPVVASVAEEQMLSDRYGSPFFFDSSAWAAAKVQTLELAKVWRQSGDDRFKDALNEVRCGGYDSLHVFNERVEAHDGESLRLTLTNEMARRVNSERLHGLNGESRTYLGQISGAFGKELPTEVELDLKEGARVMCLVNNREDGYSNGDLGTVSVLLPDAVVVDLDRGYSVTIERNAWEKLAYSYGGDGLTAEVTAKFEQIPLKLAWAVTTHKAQGQTFDRVHCDFERQAFAHGQTYVALSRCRTLAGMSLGRPLVPADIVCRPRVREWAKGWW